MLLKNLLRRVVPAPMVLKPVVSSDDLLRQQGAWEQAKKGAEPTDA